jgi:hypothetical protein
MLRKLTSIVAVSLVSGLTLFAAGCQSGEPFSLTGNVDPVTQRDRARFSDDKGHYHPEWKSNPNAYPVKNVP